MDSSTSNNSYISAQATPKITEGQKSVSPQVVSQTVPIGKDVEEKKASNRFDSNNVTLPTAYVQNNLRAFGTRDPFKTNQHGDEYLLGSTIGNTDKLKTSFQNQILYNIANKNKYNEAISSSDKSDSSYTYIYTPHGKLRVPIDENGKYSGLPEPLPEACTAS